MNGKGDERIQKMLSKQVKEVDWFESIETLAGVDVSYSGDIASAACVVTDVDGVIIQEKIHKGRARFPYVSSFFTLREFPLIYEVVKDTAFDLLFVHGHGRAHPRKFGLACHTGIYFQVPTIGVANQKLVGIYDKNFEKMTYLHYEDDIVGAVLRTCEKMNPIFVSVGHMISLRSAVEWTFSAVKNHKLPEVLRLAHAASKQI